MHIPTVRKLRLPTHMHACYVVNDINNNIGMGINLVIMTIATCEPAPNAWRGRTIVLDNVMSSCIQPTGILEVYLQATSNFGARLISVLDSGINANFLFHPTKILKRAVNVANTNISIQCSVT